MQDPEVSSILMEVAQNPSAIGKYQDNKKVAAVLEKLQHLAK